MGKLLTELDKHIEAYVVETQLHKLEELFGAKKERDPIISIINSIIRYPIEQIKKLLARIDFTKDYSDKEIDELVLSLKDEMDDMKKNGGSQHSADDYVRAYNLGKAHGQGKKVTPGYVGV